ncbi:hypothetical protein [Bosea sp. (in: a-proteobacteria)]|uniref:hypothetical protein n=1 Tax=Bosea sp. (in: a-proteobacteria) TaxID=1871050 RepID=UPI002FC5F0E6
MIVFGIIKRNGLVKAQPIPAHGITTSTGTSFFAIVGNPNIANVSEAITSPGASNQVDNNA